MDARDFLYGLSPPAIAARCNVSLHTARRWKRAGRVPSIRFALVRLLMLGELAEIERAWSGWVLRDGKLYSPEGWHVTPGEVRAIPYRRHQVRELERALSQPQQWRLF